MLARLLVLTLIALPALAADPVFPRVYNGEWLLLGEERLHIIGINAPEAMGARCDKEYKAGIKARDYLRELIASGPVEIERRNHDRYGHTLVHVKVGGRDVATAMVEAGHARRYVAGPRHQWC